MTRQQIRSIHYVPECQVEGSPECRVTLDEAPESVQNVNRHGKRLSLGFQSPTKIAFLHFFPLFLVGFSAGFHKKNTSLIYAVQEMFQAQANRNPLKL